MEYGRKEDGECLTDIEFLRSQNDVSAPLEISEDGTISLNESRQINQENDEISDESDVSDVTNDKYNELNFAVSNARSLSAKITSLLDMFRERDLDFSLVNETWFTGSSKEKEELSEIKNAENIEFICKNRRSRGGGVAIAFKSTRMKLKRLKLRENKFELVAATGRAVGDNRTIAVYSLYIPPKQTASATKDMFELIADSMGFIPRQLCLALFALV